MAQPSPAPNLEIRKMTPDDLDRVLHLARECFIEPWSRNNFRCEIEENTFSNPHVVLSKNDIIGFSIYWCFDMEAHLANFAIDPRFRRQNVGSYLLGYVISDILRRNIYEIYLEVRASNEAARNLYLKHGFKEVGVRRNYYSREREDAILMSLILKEG